MTKLQGESKAFRVAADPKQLQFKAREDKIKELQVKLNAATSNREYQALKDQIAADEMANSVLADEILEALEKADSLQTAIAEAAAALAKAKEDTEKVRREVAQREPAIQADVQRLEAELHDCEAFLPEDIREPYQRLVRHRGEEALAPIEEQSFAGDKQPFCGGCNQQITINMYNALTLNRPIFCKSCGRMLYLAEGYVAPPHGGGVKAAAAAADEYPPVADGGGRRKNRFAERRNAGSSGLVIVSWFEFRRSGFFRPPSAVPRPPLPPARVIAPGPVGASRRSPGAGESEAP